MNEEELEGEVFEEELKAHQLMLDFPHQRQFSDCLSYIPAPLVLFDTYLLSITFDVPENLIIFVDKD